MSNHTTCPHKVSRVSAVQHIRRMRGGSQSHLMRCSDGESYVVKFRNNPQHPRVLINELLGARLAEISGLPVAAPALVEVDEWLIRHTPELCFQNATSITPCDAGLQFGSRCVVNPLHGRAIDYMPVDQLRRVRSLKAFAGMLVFDKWTGNVDRRQVVFWRYSREQKYRASFIDQGYCFNAGEWTFPDHALGGIYHDDTVYKNIEGWESFEPWLSRIESMSEDFITSIVADIPSEWIVDNGEISALILALIDRRALVRDLIAAYRDSVRKPFPRWRTKSSSSNNDGLNRPTCQVDGASCAQRFNRALSVRAQMRNLWA